MHFIKSTLVLLATLSMSNALAFGFPDRYVFSLNGGIDFVNPGQEQTLSLGPTLQSIYTSNSIVQILADAGVSVSGEWDLFSFVSIQGGLTGSFNTQSTATGDVQTVAKTGPAASKYTYDLKNGRLLASGKILINLPVLSLHPYVSADLGMSFNGLSNYTQAIVASDKTPLLPFKDSTSLAMAYGFGFGVDYDLLSFLRIGGGYHFYDFGPATFAKASEDANLQPLSLPHYYGHQLRFHLSVVI